MPAIDFVAGDTATKLRRTIKNGQDGSVVDLSGATVKIKWRIDGGTLVTKDMTILDAAKGRVEYQFGAGELTADATKGESKMRGEVMVLDALSKELTQRVPFNYIIRARV
jgi:hypothetical protein